MYYIYQGILDEAVKRLGEVTKDTPRYEQVLKGLITQVSISSHWTKIKKSQKTKRKDGVWNDYFCLKLTKN